MSEQPSDNDAELALISGLLKDGSFVPVARERVRPEDFSGSGARAVYTTMLELDDQGTAVDLPTVFDALKETKRMEKAGGRSALKKMAEVTSTGASTPIYAAMVARQAQRRRARAACELAITELDSTPITDDRAAADLFGDLQSRLVTATTIGGTRHVTLSEGFIGAMKYAEERYANREQPPGYKLNIEGIDRALGGLRERSLVVLGAKTGAGKTAMALHIALGAGVQGAKVLIASYEMGVDELSLRMLANASGVSNFKVDSGKLDSNDFTLMIRGVEKHAGSKIVMSDNPPETISALCAEAQAMKRRDGLDLLIVDYLQLISGNGDASHREREVAEVSRRLKRLSMSLGICVLALSQLNRQNKHMIEPDLSDLRESGAIEQDANAVLFLWAPEPNTNIVSWKLAKNRGGPTASGRVLFNKSIQRFVDVDGPQQTAAHPASKQSPTSEADRMAAWDRL